MNWSWRQKFIFAAIFLLFNIAIAGCDWSQPVQPGEPGGDYTMAAVTRVVDGDTIIVRHLAGPELPSERIRLIGVDTPEVHGQIEPYGAEASAFTRDLVEGAVVWLEKDVSETDRYQRSLRYVWLEEPPAAPGPEQIRDQMLNARLVAGGYAQVATFPPDVKYTELFLAFQQEARDLGLGLWGLEPDDGPQIASITSPVAAGEAASVTVQAQPGAECSITVRLKSGPSRAQGLEPQVAGDDGMVTWTWIVSPNTSPGEWPVEVQCNGLSVRSELEVR